MTRKEIESLGWTECPTPDWLKPFGTYTPDRMWVIDKPTPSTMRDGFHKTYFLDYGMIFSFGREDIKGDPNNFPRFAIYKEARGGFAGTHTQSCIFAGRSMYCAFWQEIPLEEVLKKRTEELRLIMIMTGVMQEPKK